jgi:Ca2+-transporting ATPase
VKSELYERANMVYQGSFVIGGQAKALVVATGNSTEFGKLAALSVGEHEDSPVQQRINWLVSLLVRIIAGISLVAFLLSLYRGMEFTEAIRYVLALAVSAVPESLPVAITVVLVLGMRRMAKKKALVKSPAAIETIGIVTTIASDKTGTLTKNMLTVQQVWSGALSNHDSLTAIKFSTILASSKTRDPLDVAMQLYIGGHSPNVHGRVVASLPFDQEYAMSGNITESAGQLTLWVKGAPEHVIEHCTMPKKAREDAHDEVKSMAANGLRVLALARAAITKPVGSFSEVESQRFEFMGLIGVADVLRPEAPAAIKRAQAAGIRVCMVTGDHFETAFHIGRQLGIVESSDQVFDSRKMHELSDDELADIVEHTRVFARVIPEDKHRLLMVLKRSQITAMTGDGVNDVPALTGAHVGVAMGSGTSIAKDAGDIILLDNNFRSIVQAVHEGRTIYANIKRMVAYLLATNAGEVLVAVGSLIAGIPVPLTAVQILWVNLATDSFMVIPLGLEPGEKRNMLRPPQKANAPLFSKFMLSRIVLTAITMGVLTLSMYGSFIASHGVEYARTIAFNALVVMQWASAFNSRSDYETLLTRIRRYNGPFYAGLALAVFVQLIALSGFLHAALHITVSPRIGDIIWTSAVSFIVPIVIIEVHKWIGRRFFGKGSKK